MLPLCVAEEIVRRTDQCFVMTADKLGYIEHGNRRRCERREGIEPVLTKEELIEALKEMDREVDGQGRSRGVEVGVVDGGRDY